MSSYRLSWSERPTFELLRLAWPITVSLLSFGVMTFVDTLFVSRIGRSALAGVGLAGTATFAVYCFSFGLLRGVKVLVAQSIGAGRESENGSHLGAGLALALVLGVASILVGQLVYLGLPFLAASPEAGVAAQTYFQIRIAGAPFVLAFVAIREFRYGISDSRSPMVAGLLGNVVNLALNYSWVVVLHWGVAGSALATVVGHIVELATVVYVQRREGFDIGRTTLHHVRALLDVGVPTGLQFLLEMGAFTMLTIIVSTMGEEQMAAHHIALQIIHFSFLPTVALAEAGSVLAGQAVGGRRDELVLRVARRAMALSGLYTGAWTVLILLFGPRLLALFTEDVSLVATALVLLYVASAFQIADGIATVVRGVLRGAGDVKVPAQLGVVSAWLFTPPLALALGRGLGLGALGGWLGLFLEITTLAVLVTVRLERAMWKGAAEQARERLSSEPLHA